MVQMRHVHANLVRATGFELHLHQRVHAVFLQHAVVADGLAPAAADRHACAVAAVAPDGGFYRAAGDQDAIDQRDIFALDGARGELRDEVLARALGLGHHQQPRGILVEAVHDAGARQRRQRRRVVQQGIHERAFAVTGAGMHHQPRRFVDDEQLGVLVNEVERDILRRCRGHRRRRHVDLHALAAADPVALARLDAPDPHPPVGNPLLQLRTGEFRKQHRQRLIEALAGVFRREHRRQNPCWGVGSHAQRCVTSRVRAIALCFGPDHSLFLVTHA